jgi:hypothetical protein
MTTCPGCEHDVKIEPGICLVARQPTDVTGKHSCARTCIAQDTPIVTQEDERPLVACPICGHVWVPVKDNG